MEDQIEDRLLTVSDVARKLHVGRSTVWKLIKEEELPSLKVGRRRLVPMKALGKWIDKRTEGGG